MTFHDVPKKCICLLWHLAGRHQQGCPALEAK